MPDQLSVLQAALAHRYRLGPEIGRGGMAIVYRGEDLGSGTAVAIKVIRDGLCDMLGAKRFIREIAIASQLDHPHIVPVRDSGDADGVLYLVMPLVEGETLLQRIRREVQLPIDEAVRIATAIADGLSHAHRAGIVHRDIKPENILIRDGQVLIADFGLARVLEAVDRDSLSTTGLALGTPSYMSPEQASGHRQVDARSDIYSLGCVLYEMLCGEPPFTGPTLQAVAARHLAERPPSLRIVRPTIPPRLEALVERALQKVPADRFQSADEFRSALNEKADRPGSWTRRRLALATGVTALVAAVAMSAMSLRRDRLDPSRFLLVPCRVESNLGDTAAAQLEHQCDRLIAEMFRGWRDLSVAELAPARRAAWVGSAGFTEERALSEARRVGAGNVVGVSIRRSADSAWIDARLFRFAPIRTSSRAVAPLGALELLAGTATHTLRSVAQTLLFPGESDGASLRSLGATSRLPAMAAVMAGDSALLRWDLASAKERFQAAFAIDPAYSAAKLRYARTSLWAGDPASQWGAVARAAVAANAFLDPAEHAEASALVALSAGQYPESCDHYRRIIARDSASFLGWFGLAECQLRDTVVVLSPGSPSGWRFRGSVQAAHDAYRRAMQGLSVANQAFGGLPLARMAERLMAQPGVLRLGIANNDPARTFGAYPEMIGDTLVLVPYPIRELLARGTLPPSRSRALAAARRNLLDLASEWVARYPQSAAAGRAFALALELAGHIDDSIPGRPSALETVRELRSASPAAGSDLELGATEVRLLIKARRFEAAITAAQALSDEQPTNPEQGRLLSGLAAIVGDRDRAADLAARFGDTVFSTQAGDPVAVDRETARQANRLMAYAAFGEPADSIRAIAARLERTVATRIEPTARPAALDALLFLPALLSYPIMAAPTNSFLPSARLQAALQTGQRSRADELVHTILDLRRGQLPGEVSTDQAFLEVRLLQLAGDSLGAGELMDRMLASWVELSTESLMLLPHAAAIRRTMVLRDPRLVSAFRTPGNTPR